MLEELINRRRLKCEGQKSVEGNLLAILPWHFPEKLVEGAGASVRLARVDVSVFSTMHCMSHDSIAISSSTRHVMSSTR